MTRVESKNCREENDDVDREMGMTLSSSVNFRAIFSKPLIYFVSLFFNFPFDFVFSVL